MSIAVELGQPSLERSGPALPKRELPALELPTGVGRATLDQGAIGFAIENVAVGGPDLLTGADPHWGTLRVTLKNNTAGPVSLRAGSTLTLFLAPLLSDAQIHAITVKGDWTGGPVQGPHGACLAMQPAKTLSVPPGGTLALELDNVLASGGATAGYVRFEYAGFDGVAAGGQRVKVFVQAPPTWPDEWPVAFDFGPRQDYSGNASTIYVTPWAIAAGADGIENAFLLQIHNTGSDPIPLPPGSAPRFVISFLTGEGDAALCSDDQLGVVEADVYQHDPAHAWSIDASGEGEARVFTVTPDSGNATLFEPGGILTLRFRKLVTQLPAGPASPVFVQHAGLHGCNDGYTTQLLNKAAPVPYVRSFAATSGGVPVPPNGTVTYGTLTLQWDVFAAQSCSLEGVGRAFVPSDSAVVDCKSPTVSYLLSGLTGGQSTVLSQLTFSVAPPTAALSASAGSSPPNGTVTLAWTCTSGGGCTLYEDGAVIATNLPLTGSRPVTVPPRNTSYTVACAGITTATSPPVSVTVPAPGASVDNASGYSSPVYDGGIVKGFVYGINISWHTTNAVSCQVKLRTADGNTWPVSEALSGNWSETVNNNPSLQNWIRVEVDVQGNGTATASGAIDWSNDG